MFDLDEAGDSAINADLLVIPLGDDLAVVN